MVTTRDVSSFNALAGVAFATSRVTRASQREPHLGFKLDLVPARISDLASRVFPRGVPRQPDMCGLYVGCATNDIVDASTRLLDLMERPEEAELLGPLIIDEILIRLPRTPRSALGSP